MDGINQAKEGVEIVSRNAREVKDAALNNVKRGFQTIRGSGHLLTELKDLKRTATGIPKEGLRSGVSAIQNLVRLQPIEATKEIVGGITDNTKRMLRLATSPVPTAIAAAEDTGRLGLKVVKLPVTAPLMAFEAIRNGNNKLWNMYGKFEDAFRVEQPAPAEEMPNNATQVPTPESMQQEPMPEMPTEDNVTPFSKPMAENEFAKDIPMPEEEKDKSEDMRMAA